MPSKWIIRRGRKWRNVIIVEMVSSAVICILLSIYRKKKSRIEAAKQAVFKGKNIARFLCFNSPDIHTAWTKKKKVAVWI